MSCFGSSNTESWFKWGRAIKIAKWNGVFFPEWNLWQKFSAVRFARLQIEGNRLKWRRTKVAKKQEWGKVKHRNQSLLPHFSKIATPKKVNLFLYPEKWGEQEIPEQPEWWPPKRNRNLTVSLFVNFSNDPVISYPGPRGHKTWPLNGDQSQLIG